MMTSPEWTRAIFVRDPKSRLLSAYLEKAANSTYVITKARCCNIWGDVVDHFCQEQVKTFPGFVEVAHHCNNEHWEAQSNRVDEKFWPYINFIGYYHNLAHDTMTMLKQLGSNGQAWERYGKSGWGHNGTDAIYRGVRTKHATFADARFAQYYTDNLTNEVDYMYRQDYERFNFTSGGAPLSIKPRDKIASEDLDATPKLLKSDYILQSQSGWHTSPVVIEKYRLLFFTTPKVSLIQLRFGELCFCKYLVIDILCSAVSSSVF